MVHSQGMRGGVVNLAPMTLGASSMVGGWGTAGLHGRLQTFVKRALLQQLVPPGAVVCDLFCGRGTDTGNWAEAKVGKYIGIDLSASALEDAKEQWEKQGQSFPATFQELDPCIDKLETQLQREGIPADLVTCFAHLQDCFTNEDIVRRLLKNVVSILKPGGYFFGTTPDSSTIWYKYQKAVEEAMKVGNLRKHGTLPRVRSPLYTITFEDDRFHFFGSKYQLRFVDGLPAQMQLLVHFPSFIRLAEEVGLEYVELQNLTEFYEDYRLPFASTLQSSCKNLLDHKGQPMVDSKGKLSTNAIDVLSLYSTFIFKKSIRPTRNSVPLKVQLDTIHEEICLEANTSHALLHEYELKLETLYKDVIPRAMSTVPSSLSGEDSPQSDSINTTETEGETPQDVLNYTTSPSMEVVEEEMHTGLESQFEHDLDTQELETGVANVHGDLYGYDFELQMQDIDHTEEKSSGDNEIRDGNAIDVLSEDVEDVQGPFLDVQEQDETDSKPMVDRKFDGAIEGCHVEDEILQEENFPVVAIKVSCSQGIASSKNRAKRKRKRTARFRHAMPRRKVSEVTAQTCSVNYQSEVEQDAIHQEMEVSVPAPPPFLFYQRKRRTETELSVVEQETGSNGNTWTLRTLRPRRSNCGIGDPKLTPASTLKNNPNSQAKGMLLSEGKPRGFSDDGVLAGGRGRRRGKMRATIKDCQTPSEDVSNRRRATSSRIKIQGAEIDRESLLRQSTESKMRTTRMTRMRSSRGSL